MRIASERCSSFGDLGQVSCEKSRVALFRLSGERFECCERVGIMDLITVLEGELSGDDQYSSHPSSAKYLYFSEREVSDESEEKGSSIISSIEGRDLTARCILGDPFDNCVYSCVVGFMNCFRDGVLTQLRSLVATIFVEGVDVNQAFISSSSGNNVVITPLSIVDLSLRNSFCDAEDLIVAKEWR